MTDIRQPRVLYFKAMLFVFIGVIASALLLLDHPQLKTFALLVLVIWAFARAYYFVFYVIQHYIDPHYRFSGLIDFCMYIAHRQPSARTPGD
jgi:predicted MFS family arabinose efflux permease